MDNYKEASTFEKLAIKILEKYLNTSFDKEKTRTTKKHGIMGWMRLYFSKRKQQLLYVLLKLNCVQVTIL